MFNIEPSATKNPGRTIEVVVIIISPTATFCSKVSLSITSLQRNSVPLKTAKYLLEVFKKLFAIATVSGTGSQEKKIAWMADLLSQVDDEKEAAALNYELWKMKRLVTGHDGMIAEHREKALILYRKLYEKTPNIEYKERAEELEKETGAALSKTTEKPKKNAVTSEVTTKYFSELINIISQY